MEKLLRPKLEKTEEQAGLELVNEAGLSLSQRFLTFLEQNIPTLAAELKPDFDEYIQTQITMMKEYPKGDYSFGDIKRRIPNNKWIKFEEKMASLIHPLQERERIELSKEFQEDVRKRMKGRDIQ